MIRINGVDIDKIEISLMQYLEENSISPQRIAVELNEEILPKANYGLHKTIFGLLYFE